MEVGDLRKQGFSPDSIILLTLRRVNHDAQMQISQILQEIDFGSKSRDDARHINTYGILLPPTPLDIPLEEKWKALDEEASPIPKNPESIDAEEIKRLTRSFTRLDLLRRFGFTARKETYPVFNWQQHLVKNAFFKIAQAPKANNLFLLRTSIPSKNNSSTVKEDLLWARSLKKAERYWAEQIRQG